MVVRHQQRMTGHGPDLRGLGRFSMRTLVVIGGALIAIWLMFIFAGALAKVDAVNREAAQVQAENATLQARVDAGDAEIKLIQTDAFLSMEARAYGMGNADERLFALEAGAPEPRHIVPLGSDTQPAASSGPLEEWLDLLFR